MPRRKTPKSPKKPQTKTSYVLGFPHSTPAKDVVAKGKAAGISLTDKFVWAVRSDAKARKSKGAAKKKTATRLATGNHSSSTARHDHTRELRRIVIHVGVDNARSMVDQIARNLEAMAGK